MEHDRRHKRHGPRAMAPPWWEFFNFRLDRTLKDKKASIFGAVFELKNFPHYQTDERPRYVIAFRGTLLKPETWQEDVKLNFKLVLNRIQNSDRYPKGLEVVNQMIHKNVWLAGHSQGSSLALAIGREMVKSSNVHLKTYLFNPPFISLPIDQIKSNKVKVGLRFFSSIVTAGVTATVTAAGAAAGISKKDHFDALSKWAPFLFINQADPICSEYAGYFENRELMKAMGAGQIVRVDAKNSILSLFSSRQPLHLLPCAHLILNVSTPGFKEARRGIYKNWHKFKEAHGVEQWWRRDLKVECKFYQH